VSFVESGVLGAMLLLRSLSPAVLPLVMLLTLPPATEIVEATAPIAAALGVAGLTWSIVAWRRIAVYGRVLIGIGLLLIFAALIVPSLL